MSHILLLEPDTILAQTYQQALAQQGHHITWCASAQTAIDVVDTERPDIVILEPQLANHNGIEFLYELRSYTEWQSIPVIIHSLIKFQNQTAWQSLGVHTYLYKPHTSLATLQQTIGRALHATMGA
jgi:DNA-binding response OmpR family regulator